MPDEVFWQLRFEPARWIAEKHVVKVYVGTDGLHQDEFLRGDHPVTLFRGSIATPSLEAAIINSKYVNSNPLDRIARDFQTKGLNYCLNQEEYLKVFLTDGEVPIDDSASERALRNFTIGRKNWMTINTIRGAQASAVIYSLTETARANNLNVYPRY